MAADDRQWKLPTLLAHELAPSHPAIDEKLRLMNAACSRASAGAGGSMKSDVLDDFGKSHRSTAESSVARPESHRARPAGRDSSLSSRPAPCAGRVGAERVDQQQTAATGPLTPHSSRLTTPSVHRGISSLRSSRLKASNIPPGGMPLTMVVVRSANKTPTAGTTSTGY